MKDELENLYKLRDSPFTKKKFRKQIGATKTDFERICGFKSRNKEFRNWIDSLVDEGCLEFFKEDSIRGKLFVVNDDKILKRLETLPTYQLIWRFREDFLP